MLKRMREDAASLGIPAPRVAQMDIGALALTGKFAVILAPYSLITYVTDIDVARRVLQQLHALLDERGIVVLDAFIPQQVDAYSDFRQDYRRQHMNGTLERAKRIESLTDGINRIERRYRLFDSNGSVGERVRHGRVDSTVSTGTHRARCNGRGLRHRQLELRLRNASRRGRRPLRDGDIETTTREIDGRHTACARSDEVAGRNADERASRAPARKPIQSLLRKHRAPGVDLRFLRVGPKCDRAIGSNAGHQGVGERIDHWVGRRALDAMSAQPDGKPQSLRDHVAARDCAIGCFRQLTIARIEGEHAREASGGDFTRTLS